MKALLVTIMSVVLLISGAAWAESLVDVKVDELSKPVKSRWGKDPFVRLEDRSKPSGEDLGPSGLVVEGIISDGDHARHYQRRLFQEGRHHRGIHYKGNPKRQGPAPKGEQEFYSADRRLRRSGSR